MRTFTIHRRGLGLAADEVVLLPEGFSWGAALFGILWTAAHGLGRATLLLGLAWLAVLVGAPALLPADGVAVLALGLAAYAGFEGFDWRRAALERRGYHLADLILAETAEAASLQYARSALAPEPRSRDTTGRDTTGRDTTGLDMTGLGVSGREGPVREPPVPARPVGG